MLADGLSGHVVLVIAAVCLLTWLGFAARSSRAKAAAGDVPPPLMPGDDPTLPGGPSNRAASAEPPVWERYAALAGGPAGPRPTYRPRDRRATAFAAAVSGQGRYAAPGPKAAAAPLDPPAPVDYYTLFGVSRGASTDQIEDAYREYVRSIHPDRFFKDPKKHAWAQGKLREANIAIAIFRDPVRRAKYNASL